MSSEIATSPAAIEAGLPELVRQLTESLYESFDFASFTPDVYERQLGEMRRGRF